MPRILLAEDEDALRSLIARALTQDGHEVVAAADGAEALDRLTAAAGAFDLLLTDIKMPTMSGLDLAHIAHERDPAIVEAAVIPSPDPLRHTVPKAVVTVAAGYEPSRELAEEILSFARQALAPYKRVRRIEFASLPKTVSGKIRRVELRAIENARRARGERAPLEFFEEDFVGPASST